MPPPNASMAGEPLILDFSGVKSAASSFLDELLGRLAAEDQRGQAIFDGAVRIQEMNPTHRPGRGQCGGGAAVGTAAVRPSLQLRSSTVQVVVLTGPQAKPLVVISKATQPGWSTLLRKATTSTASSAAS